MITYRKPHLSYQEQVQLLKSRKLIINDEVYATQKLIHMNDKYYTFAIMIHYILNAINDTFNFKQELKNLFDKFPNIDKNAMGFPNDWENMDIWN